MHKCVFLSNGNYVLMQEIRLTAKRYDIEIVPCKYIFEMLKNDLGNFDAVLLENFDYIDKLKNIGFVTEKIFYFDDNNIVKVIDNKRYSSLEEFFDSEYFKQTNEKKSNHQSDEVVTQKLTELCVKFNTWQSRFLKVVLLDMQNMGIEKCNHKFITNEAIKYGIVRKNIYNSLRPFLKQLANNLSQKSGLQVSNKTNEIIDKIYLYTVKGIG